MNFQKKQNVNNLLDYILFPDKGQFLSAFQFLYLRFAPLRLGPRGISLRVNKLGGRVVACVPRLLLPVISESSLKIVGDPRIKRLVPAFQHIDVPHAFHSFPSEWTMGTNLTGNSRFFSVPDFVFSIK